MTGKDSGHADQDKFTAWLHSNFMSRQELESQMLHMSTEITEKIMTLVEQKAATEVYITGSSGAPSISNEVCTINNNSNWYLAFSPRIQAVYGLWYFDG